MRYVFDLNDLDPKSLVYIHHQNLVVSQKQTKRGEYEKGQHWTNFAAFHLSQFLSTHCTVITALISGLRSYFIIIFWKITFHNIRSQYENRNIAHHMSSLISSGSFRLPRSIRQDMEIEKMVIKLVIRGRPILRTKQNWCKRKIRRKERNVFLFTPTYPMIIIITATPAGVLLNNQEFKVLWSGETAVG